MRSKSLIIGLMAISCLIGFFGQCLAEDGSYVITIKDHRFDPEELVIPSGKKVKILVNNQDPSPEEFESYELNREKVVSGNDKITLFIGPLKPGIYKYFGEFHKDTAQGRIAVRENA